MRELAKGLTDLGQEACVVGPRGSRLERSIGDLANVTFHPLTLFTRPSPAWENAYIESFNGKLRDECLNREIFRNVLEAQIIIENWREEYNTRRPHSSQGYLTPVEFAERCRKRESPETPPGDADIDIVQALTQ